MVSIDPVISAISNSVTTEYIGGADHFVVFDSWLPPVGDTVDQWLENR